MMYCAFTDAAFNGLITSCPEPAAPGAISGPKNIYLCDTAVAHTYTVPLSATASSFIWSVPAGARIISGQGTRTIVVKYASTFTTAATGGVISVIGKNDCGSTGASTSYTVVKIKPLNAGAITGLMQVCPITGSSTTYSIAPVLNAESYFTFVSGFKFN